MNREPCGKQPRTSVTMLMQNGNVWINKLVNWLMKGNKSKDSSCLMSLWNNFRNSYDFWNLSKITSSKWPMKRVKGRWLIWWRTNEIIERIVQRQTNNRAFVQCEKWFKRTQNSLSNWRNCRDFHGFKLFTQRILEKICVRNGFEVGNLEFHNYLMRIQTRVYPAKIARFGRETGNGRRPMSRQKWV